MEFTKNDEKFWQDLDQLVNESKIIIDRPKGVSHPKYHEFIYPVDYGYIEGTKSMDGNGIDIWVGTKKNKTIEAIICTFDRIKRDSEIKILYGCTWKEKKTIYNILNEKFMSAIIIKRINS